MNNEENKEIDLVEQVESLLLNQTQGIEEYDKLINLYLNDKEISPKASPCGSCKNANWFTIFEKARVNNLGEKSKSVIQDHNDFWNRTDLIKCYCSKLFRESVEVKLFRDVPVALKFIPICSGNPTFIKKQ